MRAILTILALVVLATPGAANAKVKSYDMGPAGVLALDLPAGWTLARQGPDDPGGEAFVITPPANTPLRLMLTPYPVPQHQDPESAAREFVHEMAARLQPNAVETTLPLHSIEGVGGHGYFVSATDKTVTQPSATSFKYVDQGIVALGPVLLKFTSLTNLAEGPARAQVLAVLRDARISPPSPPAPPEQSEQGTIEIPASGTPLALALDLPGFDLDPIEVRKDGSATRIYGTNPATKMVVSVYVERADGAKTAADYRTKCWSDVQKNRDVEESDARFTQRGPIALLEYTISQVDGLPIEAKHFNAYLVERGLQIDVHLSKPFYSPGDKSLFDTILSSVRIVDTAVPAAPVVRRGAAS